MPKAAPERPSTAVPSRRAYLAAAAGGLLLLAGAYANAFHNEFQFDDNTVIVQNVFLRSLGNIPAFFADARTYSTFAPNMNYRPLVSTTFAVDHAIGGGLFPPVFHATNLLLLAILWGLLLAFYAHVMERTAPSPANRWLALFAATWSCVHVVNTETMNVMYNRSELLSTIGLVASFVVYWSGRGAPRRWLSLLPMAAGAFAKIPSILFAPLLLVWEYLEPSGGAAAGGDRRARLWGALRVAAPALTVAVVLYAWVEWAMHVPGQWYGGPSRYVYALTQTWAWVHYLRLFLVPGGLTADTDLAWIQSPLDPRVLAGAVVILGLCAAIVVAARRRGWLPIAFGVAWYVIGLLPASSVFPSPSP
jgi:hypothetical protein